MTSEILQIKHTQGLSFLNVCVLDNYSKVYLLSKRITCDIEFVQKRQYNYQTRKHHYLVKVQLMSL